MIAKIPSAVIVWIILNLAFNETVGLISFKSATLIQTSSNIDVSSVTLPFVPETSVVAFVTSWVTGVSIIDVAVIAQIMKVRHNIQPNKPKKWNLKCISDIALLINVVFLELSLWNRKPRNRNSLDWFSCWTFESVVIDTGTGPPFSTGPRFRTGGALDGNEFGFLICSGSDKFWFRQFWCFFILMCELHIQFMIMIFLSKNYYGIDEVQRVSHDLQSLKIYTVNINRLKLYTIQIHRKILQDVFYCDWPPRFFYRALFNHWSWKDFWI